MNVKTAKKTTTDDHKLKASEKSTVTMIPAASSYSAFNYYANHDEEREEASARFRQAVSFPTDTKGKRINS